MHFTPWGHSIIMLSQNDYHLDFSSPCLHIFDFGDHPHNLQMFKALHQPTTHPLQKQ